MPRYCRILEIRQNENGKISFNQKWFQFSFITAFFKIMKSTIYSKSMPDDSPNHSEIKMTIIYHPKKVFICMSFKNLVAAHFNVGDDEVPWSVLGWMSRGFQAGSCSDNQLCHLGWVSLSGPQVSHCEARRPGWDQRSSTSHHDPTTGSQACLVRDRLPFTFKMVWI